MSAVNKQGSGTKDLLDPENFQNNEEIMITREIPNTPFIVVGMLDEKRSGRNWFGCLGNIRLTEMLASEEEAIKNCTEITWDNIIKVIAGLQEFHSNQNKNKLKSVK